jgi:AcrR family transcriptional regulator
MLPKASPLGTAKPRTARERARAELTGEIQAIARRQLAEVGAPALSLRAVARELGMVSSAVYRYFPSRDDLLTALIIESFDAVGAVAEQAYEASSGGVVARWLALSGAIRRWAVANPQDYALVYGSPVPGYEAPRDTVPPAARVSLVGIRLVADGLERDEIDPTPTASVPRPVHADFARLRDLAAPGLPDEVLGRMLLAWTAMFGGVSYELFGHLHRVIEDYGAFFEHQMGRAGRLLLGTTAD